MYRSAALHTMNISTLKNYFKYKYSMNTHSVHSIPQNARGKHAIKLHTHTCMYVHMYLCTPISMNQKQDFNR